MGQTCVRAGVERQTAACREFVAGVADAAVRLKPGHVRAGALFTARADCAVVAVVGGAFTRRRLVLALDHSTVGVGAVRHRDEGGGVVAVRPALATPDISQYKTDISQCKTDSSQFSSATTPNSNHTHPIQTIR
jgi:hypothetical protein